MTFDVFFEIDYNYTNKVQYMYIKLLLLILSVSYPLLNGYNYMASCSVAYRYRKSISIIELFVSIYIGFLATNF